LKVLERLLQDDLLLISYPGVACEVVLSLKLVSVPVPVDRSRTISTGQVLASSIRLQPGKG
jgi:hypothetical protein